MMATLQPVRLQVKKHSKAPTRWSPPRALVVQAACIPWGSGRPSLGSSPGRCNASLITGAFKSSLKQRKAHAGRASRALTVTTKAMVNVDFASPSLVLGAVLIGCGVLLLQMRNLQTRVSRDADIVVAAMVSIVGSTLIFQGWRLDPLLLLCQALTTSVAVWYGIETFRLRSKEEEEQEVAERMLPPPQQQGGAGPNWVPPPGMSAQQQPYQQQQPGGPIQDLMQAFMTPQQYMQQGPGQQQQQQPLDYASYQQQQQQQGMYLPPAQDASYPWTANPGAMYTPQEIYDQQQQAWQQGQQGYLPPTTPQPPSVPDNGFYADSTAYYPPQQTAGGDGYAGAAPPGYGYPGSDAYQQPAAGGFEGDQQGLNPGYGQVAAGEAQFGGAVRPRDGSRVAASAVGGQRAVEQIDDWE